MKKMLFATTVFLVLVTSVSAYERAEDGPMKPAQAEILRLNAVTIAITDVNDRALSKKATAKYEALLSNPFTRSINCDIVLTSIQDNAVVDTKTHAAVYAPARSAQKVKGEITIKRGKKENDGLQWATAKSEFVQALNCKFLD